MPQFLKYNYDFYFAYSVYLWSEFLLIQDVFNRNGVVFIPLKGIAFCEDIYTAHTFRQMVDIDVLVKTEDVCMAEALLVTLGYVKELGGLREEYWLQKQCHITFTQIKLDRFPLTIDVHFALDFKRETRGILPSLLARIKKVEVDNRQILFLSPEDTLFSIALHQRRRGKPLCLKNVIDVVLLLEKYGSTFDWDYVLKEARNGAMCSALYFLLLQARIFLNISLPQHIWDSLKPGYFKASLMGRFIKNNAFSLSFIKHAAKESYLKSHFLLYDTWREPISYIVNIPQEQFAKFYELNPYALQTEFAYKNRYLYMSKGILKLTFQETMRRVKGQCA